MDAETIKQVTIAALKGTCELFVLTIGGYYLAAANILKPDGTKLLAKLIFQLLLPCLLFSSLLQSATGVDFSKLWTLPVSALVNLFISLGLGLITITAMTYKYAITDRLYRSCLVAMVFCNANQLPILLINALCSFYEPLQGEEQCLEKAIGFTSLILMVWSTVCWSIGMPYLENAKGDIVHTHGELIIENHVPTNDERHELTIAADTVEWETESKNEHAKRAKTSAKVSALPPPLAQSLSDDLIVIHPIDTYAPKQNGYIFLGNGNELGNDHHHVDIHIDEDKQSSSVSPLLSSEMMRVKSHLVPLAPASNDHFGIAEDDTSVTPQHSSQLLGLAKSVFKYVTSIAPPTLAIFSAIILSRFTFLKQLVLDQDAPLRFIIEAQSTLGISTLTLSSLVVGGNLRFAQQIGFSRAGISFFMLIAVAICRLVLVPLTALGGFIGLRKMGWIPASAEDDRIKLLVILVEFITPSANNIVVMSEIANHSQSAMSAVLLLQYILAPFVMTVSTAVVLALV